MLTITRGKEATFPTFINHHSARKWFKTMYGNRFVMQRSDWINGEKVYFYHLVLDRECYLKSWDKLKKGEVITDDNFISSYQPVEIFENGNVHVIH